MNEKQTRQETEAAQSGEETCAVRRGAEEGVGSEEVTQEMKYAGSRIFGTADVELESTEDIVSRIFVAMLREKTIKKL